MRKRKEGFSAIMDAVIFMALLMLASGAMFSYLASQDAGPTGFGSRLQDRARNTLLTFLHLHVEIDQRPDIDSVSDLAQETALLPGAALASGYLELLEDLLREVCGPAYTHHLTVGNLTVGSSLIGDRGAWEISWPSVDLAVRLTLAYR